VLSLLYVKKIEDTRMAKSRGSETRRANKRTKSYRLEQRKIDRAKRILGVATETEAMEQALDLVAIGHTLASGTRRARRVAVRSRPR
jgi:hypothetical protein